MQPSLSSPVAYRFRPFEVDLLAAELHKRGRKIPLQDQPFKVLALLLRSAGQVVMREDLQRALWPDDTSGDFDEGLNKSIQKLRQALDDSSDSPRFIETVPRKGYRFIAAVEAFTEPAETGAVAKGWRRREALPWALFATALVALAAVAAIDFREQPGETHAVRFQFPVPDRADLFVEGLDVSPNGRHAAFITYGPDEKPQLWVHSFSTMTTRRLAGAKLPAMPFWSPESRFVGFFEQAEGSCMKKIDLTGGPPQTIRDTGAASFNGANWGRDGTILVALTLVGGHGEHDTVYRVSAAGGELTPVTQLDKSRQEVCQGFPRFLPDGRHFLYQSYFGTLKPNELTFRASQTLSSAVMLGALDSRETIMLIQGDSNVSYVPPGFLVYGREGTLLAQPFDLRRLRLTGDPVPVAGHVDRGFGQTYAFGSAAENDLVVYANEASHEKQLAWYKRDGARLGPIGEIGRVDFIVLSPSEKQLAVTRKHPESLHHQVWICELSTGIFTRLTSGEDSDINPAWSPDGRYLAYASNHARPRPAGLDIYRKPAGGGEPELLLSDRGYKMPRTWLTDGSLLFDWCQNSACNFCLLPPSGGKPMLLHENDFLANFPTISPDGRWVAYQSRESGRFEIYVAAFPSFKEKRQVSNHGGAQARWRKDGKELFYVNSQQVMSVDLNHGSSLETGAPRLLFQVPFRFEEDEIEYAVTGDGQKFIFGEPAEAGKWLYAALNWTTGLKR